MKLIQRLMLAVIVSSTFHFAAKTQNCSTGCNTTCPTTCPTTCETGRYTNKTFLMPRPHGVDLPMEMTTFHRFHHKNKYTALDNFGANLQVTGFYTESGCSSELGSYFGVKHKNSFTFSGAATDTNNTVKIADQKDLDLFYILHNAGLTTEQAKTDIGTTSICLKPEHIAYGLRFDLYHNLDRITPGLFFKASMPIVHIDNDVRLRATSDVDGLQERIINYFKGKTIVAATNPQTNQQCPLKFAKYECEQINTGVADIDLALGYHFLYQKDYALGLAAAITIPTGNEPTGEYLFEAIYGNGHHFGLGADLYGHYKLWKKSYHKVIINLMAKYRYLFESQETRTLGLQRPATNVSACDTNQCTTIDWGHYYLLGDTQKNQLVPAANILTQYVDITPGSIFDGILSLTYGFKGFTFDLGYNFYFKEKEAVRLRKKLDENRYAIAARNYQTSSNFTIEDNNVDGGNIEAATISTNPLRTKQIQITTCMAATPQQITHGVFGGLGYIFKDAKYPVMLGIGGKYDWKDENAAIEKWSVWGKIGINF